MKLLRHYNKHKKGFLLVGVLVFMAIALAIMTAFVTWGQTSMKLSRIVLAREQALDVAEAGIEHARWYLAHYHTDYTLGYGNNDYGPHTYTFNNKDGDPIGTYTITVTPPQAGSTIVGITSRGSVNSLTSATRTIKVQLAIPSLAKYALLANDTLRIGEGTIVYGPMHSNAGIHFDGLAYNLVTSAVASYDDPDHNDTGTQKLEFGVHTHVSSNGAVSQGYQPDEAPPNPVPTRTDVFRAGRSFPVPAVDFAGITSDLSAIKTQAQNGGVYFAASGALGYQVVLKTNDTFDVYRVTGLAPSPKKCTETDTGWGTWSITTQSFVGNYAFPTNGLIFFEDNVWVEGTINSARITIAAASFPDNINTRKSITVNNNLLYTNTDGTDAIGLIAQNNINVGMVSQNQLEIDGALIAQNGRVGRFYYGSFCSTYSIRDTIKLYGMIATNLRYGFSYTDGTGYTNRILTYDTHLLYGPPPFFPLAADNYQIVSWEELE